MRMPRETAIAKFEAAVRAHARWPYHAAERLAYETARDQLIEHIMQTYAYGYESGGRDARSRDQNAASGQDMGQ